MKTGISILILAYQMLTRGLLPRSCRYEISCSDFMLKAVAAQGVRRGVVLGLKRLMTCHPFARNNFMENIP